VKKLKAKDQAEYKELMRNLKEAHLPDNRFADDRDLKKNVKRAIAKVGVVHPRFLASADASAVATLVAAAKTLQIIYGSFLKETSQKLSDINFGECSSLVESMLTQFTIVKSTELHLEGRPEASRSLSKFGGQQLGQQLFGKLVSRAEKAAVPEARKVANHSIGPKPSPRPSGEFICFHCRKPGHVRSACPDLKGGPPRLPTNSRDTYYPPNPGRRF